MNYKIQKSKYQGRGNPNFGNHKLAGKNHPCYIDGRTLIQYYCKESKCNNKISLNNWRSGQGRCQSCSSKNMWQTSTRIKNRNTFGKKNGNYIDGRTPLNETIRKLTEYDEWRNKVFKKDNYTCQECGQYGGNIEAHHKNPFAELLSEFLEEYNQFSPYEEKEILTRLAMKYKSFWNINNGETTCIKCHSKIDKYRKISIKR